MGQRPLSRYHWATMIRRILFAGDSITRGKLGIGYVPLLGKRFPDCELINLGQDGDTVFGIKNRTCMHLAGSETYNVVVIAAGHNDVILDTFKHQSYVYKSIARQMERRGSIPAPDYDGFLSTYRSFLDELRATTEATVVVATLSCINEDRTSPTAERRQLYNQGIRALATERDVPLADVGAGFDGVLSARECRDYFLPKPLATLFFDTWKSRTSGGADELSSKRRLHLTIDGVHLNARGARIYEDTIAGVLDYMPRLREP